jgi:hypothetical protein
VRSQIVPNARLVMAGLCLSVAIGMQYMTEFGVRMSGMFLLGYLFHGLLHSTEMMLDHGRLERSWDLLAERRKQLFAAEQQILASKTGEPS